MKFLFLLTFILTGLTSLAQQEKADKETLAKMDTTALKGKAFLNKALVIGQLIEPLRTKDKNKGNDKFLTLSPRYFEALALMVCVCNGAAQARTFEKGVSNAICQCPLPP